jgi:integrase
MRMSVRDSKTETGVRSVFVPPWAGEAVSKHIEDHGLSVTDLLFTHQRRTVQAEHNRACDLVGIPEYTIHDHRHTAAVTLARAGMPLHILQRQLGHKHVEMTMKYAAFHPEYSDVTPHFNKMGRMLGLYRDDGSDDAEEDSGDSLGDTPSLRGINAGVEK